jgi:hypothetical protein
MVIGQQYTEGRFFLSHLNQRRKGGRSQIKQFTRFARALVTGVVVLLGVSVEAAMISLMLHKGTAGQQRKTMDKRQKNKKPNIKQQTKHALVQFRREN